MEEEHRKLHKRGDYECEVIFDAEERRDTRVLVSIYFYFGSQDVAPQCEVIFDGEERERRLRPRGQGKGERRKHALSMRHNVEVRAVAGSWILEHSSKCLAKLFRTPSVLNAG
jgi:hypothetical protein